MKHLIKANALIKKISKENKYITPISLKDFDLFQQFFRKEKHTYGNSWTYVTQGMYGIGPHNLGYKYYDGKNLSAISIHPKIEQPDMNVFYWVRPMGPNILEIISKFSHNLLEKEKIPTYVKKIFKKQYNFLLKNKFKDSVFFPWHSVSPAEDDTFPEQIYNIAETLKQAQHLPRKIDIRRSFIEASKLPQKYKITISSKNFKKIAWNIANIFFNTVGVDKKINLSNKYDYYNMIFQNPSRPDLKREIIFVNQQPLGFYVAEKNDSIHTSLYATIILRDKIRYLVDYTLFYIFRTINTPFINKGGSEDQGIHAFKCKYRPIKQQQMYWVTSGIS